MLRSSLGSILFVAPALAQISQGPLVGVPVHHVVRDNTLGPAGVLDTNQLYLKRAGFLDLDVANPFGPTRPMFTMDAMFGLGRPAGFEVDALSSGYCTVFCTWNAVGDPILTVPAGAWGGLMFSVTKGTPGGDAAVVVTEAGRPDGPGADVFSLVLPGSTLPSSLNCVPIGVAQRANDSSEMGLQWAPGMRPDIGDFDPFLSFYEAEGPLPSFLNPQPWLYFSVPRNVAPLVPTWFTTRNGAPLAGPHSLPSGATILRIKWSTTPPQWSTPEVFLSYLDLGLDVDEDIDALSVQESTSGLVLLSLRRPPPPLTQPIGKQLMVASFSWDPSTRSVAPDRAARVYLFDDGTNAIDPVAKIAGAGGNGDVDAVCEFDPSNLNGVAVQGFPYVRDCRSDLPFPTTMHASAFWTRPTTPGVMSVAVSVTGMTALPAWYLWGVALVSIPPTGGSLPPTLSYVLLTPGPVTGTNQNLVFDAAPIPASLGMELEFQVVTLDLVVGNIELARVVRLRV